MKRTIYRALIVIILLAATVSVAVSPTATAAEPLVKFSPTKLMTTGQTSAQAWVRNNTDRKVTVHRTIGNSAVKSVIVKPGLQRVDFPAINRGESAKVGLSATVNSTKFSYSSYITRPSLLGVDRSLETVTESRKKIIVALESDKKVIEVTNAVIYARDGRTIKCLAKDFDMRFEYSPMCEIKVPGDFIPNQVNMVFFTKKMPNQQEGTVGVKLAAG